MQAGKFIMAFEITRFLRLLRYSRLKPVLSIAEVPLLRFVFPGTWRLRR
jgi:hypothetical protein